MTYYYDDYREPRRIWRRVGVGLALVALAGAGFLALQTFAAPSDAPIASAGDVTTTIADTPATTTRPLAAPTSTIAATTTTELRQSASSTSTSSTTLPSVSTTTVAEAPPATLPDGSAVPVVAIFDVSTITLAGSVRSQEAADRLAMLAVANSKTPAAVIDLLTVDPSVPAGVGVRIVELTSARFPTGSAEVVADHAAELDRMAAVMEALPNTSVLVIGHADQVGAERSNQRLSERRAAAVVNYLVDAGVDAERLSSRAVGESDLLSLDSDAASLALNRRTEFVMYGVLVGY